MVNSFIEKDISEKHTSDNKTLSNKKTTKSFYTAEILSFRLKMFQYVYFGLILSFNWSLSVQSVVGIYDSGIWFESRKYPG